MMRATHTNKQATPAFAELLSKRRSSPTNAQSVPRMKITICIGTSLGVKNTLDVPEVFASTGKPQVGFYP
jgi:hypothetical protein